MTIRALLAGASGLLLLLACGEPAPATDAGPGLDAGTGETDAGPGPVDAGPGTDAGPDCRTGCGYVELELGVLHACGRQENQQVRCWGRNQELQLGDGSGRHQDCASTGSEPEDCSALPVKVRADDGVGRPELMDADDLTVEGVHQSCALRGGELWCWGEETIVMAGGIPDQRPVAERELATTTGIAAASVGSGHLCVVTGDDADLRCAGRSNGYGQQGNGTVIDPVPVLTPVLISTGPEVPLTGVLEVVTSFGFSCARTATDVYCFGRNEEGQLGEGESYMDCDPDVISQVDCSPFAVRVGGDASPLGATIDIDAGGSHACAIVEGGTAGQGQVWCWGDNRAGQCGQTVLDDVNLPAAVAGVDDAVQVATGSAFTCALRAGGTVSCWGFNDHRQLGDDVVSHGPQCTRGDVMEDCSATPVTVSTIDDATYLAANGGYACVVRGGDGSVWCWGANQNRQCGVENRIDQPAPMMVLGTDAI